MHYQELPIRYPFWMRSCASYFDLLYQLIDERISSNVTQHMGTWNTASVRYCGRPLVLGMHVLPAHDWCRLAS